MARRSQFKDDPLASDETREERRAAARAIAELPATLQTGELHLDGTITDVAPGGVFYATRVVIEVGERGTLIVDEHQVDVQVMWLRGNHHPSGPGMGLAFEDEPEKIRRLYERLAR